MCNANAKTATQMVANSSVMRRFFIDRNRAKSIEDQERTCVLERLNVELRGLSLVFISIISFVGSAAGKSQSALDSMKCSNKRFKYLNANRLIGVLIYLHSLSGLNCIRAPVNYGDLGRL
jgi:hypothetical protein